MRIKILQCFYMLHMWVRFISKNFVPPQPALAVCQPRTRCQTGCRGSLWPPLSCIWLLPSWCLKRCLAASWAGCPEMSGWGGLPAREFGSWGRARGKSTIYPSHLTNLCYWGPLMEGKDATIIALFIVIIPLALWTQIWSLDTFKKNSNLACTTSLMEKF